MIRLWLVALFMMVATGVLLSMNDSGTPDEMLLYYDPYVPAEQTNVEIKNDYANIFLSLSMLLDENEYQKVFNKWQTTCTDPSDPTEKLTHIRRPHPYFAALNSPTCDIRPNRERCFKIINCLRQMPETKSVDPSPSYVELA